MKACRTFSLFDQWNLHLEMLALSPSALTCIRSLSFCIVQDRCDVQVLQGVSGSHSCGSVLVGRYGFSEEYVLSVYSYPQDCQFGGERLVYLDLLYLRANFRVLLLLSQEQSSSCRSSFLSSAS